MATNPWDLVRELSSMQDRMNRMLGSLDDRGQEDVTSRGSWLPPVEIHQTDGQHIVLKAEVPGLRREDIELTVEHNTLTLKGQRRPEEKVREDLPPSGGSLFNRSFALPSTIDTGTVRADYRDGVLTVTLPLRQEARPRQIQVALND